MATGLESGCEKGVFFGWRKKFREAKPMISVRYVGSSSSLQSNPEVLRPDAGWQDCLEDGLEVAKAKEGCCCLSDNDRVHLEGEGSGRALSADS